MSISADHESNKIYPQKSLRISMVVGLFVSLTDGFTVINGVIMGGILFICGLIPIVYIYNL